MKTITSYPEIAATFDQHENLEGAHATCRCLPGQWEQAHLQEWAEHCTINGAPAKIYYMFENDEADVEDGSDMPWDAEHVDRIEIAEQDDDGFFDQL